MFGTCMIRPARRKNSLRTDHLRITKEVSLEFRQQYPDLPWMKIVGLRNILAHEYGEVKDEKIYLVVTRDIPLLIVQLKSILEKNAA